jgi:four helix bundle protein
MADDGMPSFDEWVRRADEARTGDPLWTVQAYRLSVYAVECHAFDRRAHASLPSGGVLDQLTRAIGSIPANIAEGYSRGSLPDRTRFYGYALGSAREAITWYDSLKFELENLATTRQGLLIQVRRLLLTTLRRSRPDGSRNALRDVPAADPGP